MDHAPPLDRAAVERVLRRASELADAEPTALPAVGGVDAEALVAAAAEVGIPEDAVRRAIARERLGPPAAAHLGDRLVGAATVVVDSEVPGRAAEVLARLDVWLVAGHHLRRDRLRDGRGEWSKRTRARRRDVPRRCAASSGKASSAICTASWPWPPTPAPGRAWYASRPTAITTAPCVPPPGRWWAPPGRPASSSPRWSLGPVLLVVVPVTAVAGFGLAATGRGRASRVGRELDRVLDAVDQQVKPARLGVDVVRRVAGTPRRVSRLRRRPASRRKHLAVEPAVGADGGVAVVGRHAVAVGERAAGLLDEKTHGGDVVGRHADGVDGDVERALGDEGVLPEVAEPPAPPGIAGRGRRAPASGRGGPSRR